jgi:histidyl-tRNA synthetase
LILGESEAQKREIQAKNLAIGEQTSQSLTDFLLRFS